MTAEEALSTDLAAGLGEDIRFAPQRPAGLRSSHSPIFILAPPRSGSTVVTTMLGEHPQLASFPELRLFEAEQIGETLRRRPETPAVLHDYNRSGLLRALAQVHVGEQTDEAIIAAAKWLGDRSAWSCFQVLDYLLDAIAPLTGVENSPETASNPLSLHRAIESYPKARLIHLVRHPVPTIRSIVSLWSQIRAVAVSESLYRWAASVWLSTHARLLDIDAALGPGTMLRLRAEDVINRPHRMLGEVARWLEISAFDDAIEQMTHPENSPYAFPGPRLAPGGGDRSFFASPWLRTMLVPDRLEFPDEWGLERPVIAGMSVLAETLGYAG
jgi:hypothetical protein